MNVKKTDSRRKKWMLDKSCCVQFHVIWCFRDFFFTCTHEVVLDQIKIYQWNLKINLKSNYHVLLSKRLYFYPYVEKVQLHDAVRQNKQLVRHIISTSLFQIFTHCNTSHETFLSLHWAFITYFKLILY